MTATTAPGSSAPPARPHRVDERGSWGSLFSDALVFTRRNLEHIRQIPEKLTEVTVQPLMFVVLFAYVFGGAIAVDGGGYREYLLGGILIQSLTFGMMGPATAIATDLTEGVIDRFRSLPTRRAAYLLGHYFAELAGLVLSIVVLLGAGLIVGWRPHTSVASFAAGILLLLVFSSAIVWFGLWLGMMVRSPDAVMGVGFIVVFPLTFLSNAFVPIESLTSVLQWVASVNPVSVLVAAVRTLFGNPVSPVTKHVWPMDHPVAAAWIYSVVFLAIAVTGAIRRYVRRTTD
jgi:ABC transporter DrrB family efflux protein